MWYIKIREVFTMLDSTRQFIQAMDAKNIKHSDIEVTQSGMEKVTVI